MQNKPNFLIPKMNLSSVKTMNYEQITTTNANKNKPNLSRRSRREAEIPTGELLEILKPGTNPTQTAPPMADCHFTEIQPVVPMIGVRDETFSVTIAVLPKRTYKWHRY
jgi:hypothetical protein